MHLAWEHVLLPDSNTWSFDPVRPTNWPDWLDWPSAGDAARVSGLWDGAARSTRFGAVAPESGEVKQIQTHSHGRASLIEDSRPIVWSSATHIYI